MNQNYLFQLKTRFNKVLDYALFIMLLVATTSVLSPFFSSNIVAKGTRLILIPILIFFACFYLQIKKILELHRKGLINSFYSGSKFDKILMKVCFGFGILSFVSAIALNIYAYTSGAETQIALQEKYDEVLKSYNIFSIVLGVLFLVIVSMAIIAMLYSSLFLGKLAFGVNISIGVHNFFNNGAIDFNAILLSTLDVSLPDLWALLLNIGWFLISHFINNPKTT